MNGIELYIVFIALIVGLSGLLLAYTSLSKFEILITLFALSTFIASLFYNNIPEWIQEERATGLGGYLRGGILLFCGVMGLTVFILKSRIHNWKIPIHLIMLFLFIFFSFMSTLYSIDSKNTLTRASLFFLLFLFILSINYWLDSEEKLKRMMNTLFYVVAFILIVNLISLVVAPARVWWWKTPSRFLGMFSHPNELGGFCIVGFPIILWKIYNSLGRNKKIAISIFVLNLFILIITGSRTSLLTSAIGITIWLVLNKDWVKLLALTILLLFGITILSQIKIAGFQREENSKITDLTEREDIWSGAFVFAKKQPVLGYGYSVESKIFANQLTYDIGGTSLDTNAQNPLHNGFLSIFIGGGIIGLILWILTLGLPIYYISKSRLSTFKCYALATMIPILVANMVESALTGYLSSSDIYFWLAWAVAGKSELIKNDIA